MPQTRRFIALRAELARARRVLLPQTFSTTGSYSANQDVKSRAYRIISHAEIESFLEDRATYVAQTAYELWLNSSSVSLPLCAMVSFSILPEGNTKKPLLSERIKSAYEQFRHDISQNHGVKEDNLKTLLLPIGFDFAKLDPLFVTEMTSFGKLRGAAAHSTARTSSLVSLDPKLELERIEQKLLPHLARIDSELRLLE